MPRNYKRKAPSRRVVTQEQLEAAKLLISKGASKRQAASQVGIEESSLRKRLKCGNTATSLGRFFPTFTNEQENEIYKYMKRNEGLFNGLTMQKLQEFIYEYAEVNGITHRFNTSTKLAGQSFVYGFLKRFPDLKLRHTKHAGVEVGLNVLSYKADPAQVPSGGGEGSQDTKPAENTSQQDKFEEVLIKKEVKQEPLDEVLPNSPGGFEEVPIDQLQVDSTQIALKVEPKEEKQEESAPVEEKKSKEEDKPKESASSGNWQHREQELLKKIEELEKVKIERSEDGLRLELKVREEEIDLLKARVKNLETELQAALSKPGGKNQEMIDKIKQQHEELLSKARGMIFDKTKMVKNQELQIEALTTQVQSLKDINLITKDLLEIRNSEVKAMDERFQAMEARFKGEKERYDLVLKRAQTSNNINDDLRKEYETQLAIFKELREKYEMRVQALVAENNRLKESLQGGVS